MSNNQDCQLGAWFSNLLDCSLNFHFRFRVKCWRGFIKDQYFWTLNQRSSNCNALLLPPWHIHYAGCANKSVEPLLLFKNELGVCLFNGVKHVFLASIFVTVKQIVTDGSHNHNWLLSHVPDALAQCLEVDLFNVLTVKTDLAAIPRVVKSFNQLYDCWFTTSRRPNDSSGASSFNCETGVN